MDLSKYVRDKSSQSALARKLNVSQGLIYQWLNGITRITGERAVQIEMATDGDVTREELRPDLFGAPARRMRA